MRSREIFWRMLRWHIMPVVLIQLSAFAHSTSPLNITPSSSPGFTSVDPVTSGILFSNICPQARSITNQVYLNGSGLAAADIDADGWCDLFFSGLERSSRLYKNLGNWRFADITSESGLAGQIIDGTGAVLADLDGDTDFDLVVSSVGFGTKIFFNDGRGKFTPSLEALNGKLGGTSIALADIDADGDLDLYLANYRSVTIRDQPNSKFTIQMINGKPQVTKMDGRPITEPDLQNRFNFDIKLQDGRGNFTHDELGEPDSLLVNDGKGKFTPVSWTDGSFLDENGRPLPLPPFDWGLSVMMRDFTGDGAPDIYVCNDFKSPDRIWLNDGKGRFRAAPANAFRHISLSSMGMDIADVNRDGHDDIFVLDMLSRDHTRRLSQVLDLKPEPIPSGDLSSRPQYAHNTLFLNRGDGSWIETAFYSGLAATEWSWTPIFLDVDFDGFEDLLVSNGFERDTMNTDIVKKIEAEKNSRKLSTLEQLNLRRQFPPLATKNLAFRNLGSGKFSEISKEWSFALAGISQGMILADLDRDGDMDVICNNFNSAPCLLKNNGSAPRILVRLRGLGANRHGIGAEIRLISGSLVQKQQVVAGGRYLSGDEPCRTFAAPVPESKLEVRWPSGKISRLTAHPNNEYLIDEKEAELFESKPAEIAKPLFKLVELDYVHLESPFDDYARQPSLPWTLSKAGPGLCWFDFNGDGMEDLVLGAGRRSRPGLFLNQNGKLLPHTNHLIQAVTRDIHGMAASAPVLYTALSNYEDGLPTGSAIRQMNFQSNKIDDSLSATNSSPGPIALVDIDADGDLDLFRGGYCIPGKYPFPASSMLYRNENGTFKPDAENSVALKDVGLISGATFSDINSDGWPDLLLACQWGPPKLFLNEKGRLVDQTSSSGLLQYPGLWNGVAAGDFNDDGRVDFVASNLGSNSFYEPYRHSGIRLYYGDWDEDGTCEMIEAYFEPEMNDWVPLRGLDWLSRTIPSMAARFNSHSKYAAVTIAQLFGSQFLKCLYLEAKHLESTVFLNESGRFRPIPLPFEAQISAAFGIVVADFDGDANLDLFLAQNFFGFPPENTRLDSGCGLVLRGLGDGQFQALPPKASGISIFGEQRGCATADFDHDGRVDLVVAQNSSQAKLLHNQSGQQGLRLRLDAGSGNPYGVGAQYRVQLPGRSSVTREIEAGSGYFSQNGSVQVIPRVATRIEVLWPGGGKSTHTVPENAREIEISPASLRIIR